MTRSGLFQQPLEGARFHLAGSVGWLLPGSANQLFVDISLRPDPPPKTSAGRLGLGHDLAVPRIIAQSVELRITLELKAGIATLDCALQAVEGLLLVAGHGIYLCRHALHVHILRCQGQCLANWLACL